MAEKKSKPVPVDTVLSLRKQGYSNSQIIENLRNQNYSLQEISDAINQSEIKNTINQDVGLEDAPSPSGQENMDFPNPPEFNIQSSQNNFRGYQPGNQPVDNQIPQYQGFIGQQRDTYTERIEEIAESIVKEKWEDFVKDIGDMTVWKERVKTDILSIKQELIRTQERFDSLQRAVLGKVSEYDKDVKEIGTEIKALEKVLEKILEPLTTNIKDLQKVTEELKRKKRK
ncbi:hypothetical protein HYX18_03290 [Candidatus Woesearchaeota archaeon]|nr:hypothetical protein [Candidatus Woesearchaeota archaeon]